MCTTRSRPRLPLQRGQGFTLLELMVAITIAGLVLAVSVPASMKLYQSMQYRQAVRDVVTLLASARYSAVRAGVVQDVEINAATGQLRLNNTLRQLPGDMTLAVHSAQELNHGNVGVIRFYPEGGASGGGVDVQRANGAGVTIEVDWLMGRVSQAAYGAR